MPDATVCAEARILIVDDQEANVRLLERIFAQGGFANVASLTDARLAAETYRSFLPDLVLLDLHMPHLDGFRVLEQLRIAEDGDDRTPIIVLTADADPSVRQRALSMGAQDFLTKPFDGWEVLLRSRNLLVTRFLYRDLADRNRVLADEIKDRIGELKESRATHDAILASLGRLSTGATLEETAAAVCAEFAKIDQYDGFVVFGFTGDDTATIVAWNGRVDLSALTQSPIPASRAALLRQRASDGAWASRWQSLPEFGRYGEVVDRLGIHSAWYAPLTAETGVIGVLAAFSRQQLGDAELQGRLPLVVEFAAIARSLLAPALTERSHESVARGLLREVIAQRGYQAVFQPIVDMVDGTVIGHEALTRFADGTPPDLRFAEAHRLGLGLELEEATLLEALRDSRRLPTTGFVSLNVSPAMLLAEGRLPGLLNDSRRMVVLELTEHVAIADYAPLREALHALGDRVRLAIDDAGAGYASFRHILEMRPDFVKIDRDLIHDIDTDPLRQALVVGMRYFAQQTGCTLISEGVETDAERDALRRLNIQYGQGYLLARPARVGEAAPEVSARQKPRGVAEATAR